MVAFLKYLAVFLIFGFIWFFIFSIPVSKNKNVFVALQKELKIGALPNYLLELKFGKDYNKKIKLNVLPKTLKVLEFGDDYNQDLELYIFPDSIEVLIFGKNFKKPINKHLLPLHLKKLVLPKDYSFNITEFIDVNFVIEFI